MPLSPFELDLYLKCHLETLLEGVEMPQDRDEIHIKQTKDVGETSQNSTRRRTNAFFPSLPTATEDDLQELSSLASHKQVCLLSPMGTIGNVEIVLGDYFQLSNNNILQPDHISQAVDVASKVLQYEGIMLIILPRSLLWGGLLATMVENDDSRLVEFASGCLLLNIPVETKGVGGRIQKYYTS
ncbi:hypothetical protein SELMODRAFT_419559 [Selaginella moellendorffii]|uniref:Uncharacterized protein n=1 Tax=Selaginella moellendorffii TaxID=88036 RepID=D8S9B6_SELML|nr:hypothetical protein SELMODRAFT_419559 [Selaginella moellendorffii]